ncbi:hypothetical protein DdX_16554 [Ditylenchus destructor]|uniref:Uncharacterized protein n=1 Tax=Ditylenchus destructor TaxID=166010 RepID=A0AAD4MQ70_9BILA|nr:hypothetical protein DdX_16554 [Ditylenchus destructor]
MATINEVEINVCGLTDTCREWVEFVSSGLRGIFEKFPDELLKGNLLETINEVGINVCGLTDTCREWAEF